VEVFIYTYFFIDSTHAMEHIFKELSFVWSSQNIVLSDRIGSAHCYAFLQRVRKWKILGWSYLSVRLREIRIFNIRTKRRILE